MEDLVVEALFNGGRETQIRAATYLTKLTTEAKNLLVDKGVVTPLVFMLCSKQDYEAIEAALFALLSLATRSQKNKILIAESGAVPIIVDLLRQKSSSSLSELATTALLILSSCTKNKPVIVAAGAIQLLVDSLTTLDNITTGTETGRRHSSVQANLDAISALHNLSTCHQLVPSIVSAGVVFPLLQLVYNSNKASKLTEKALALLEKIAASSEIAVDEIASTQGGILALVEAVEGDSQQSREHAVGVLLSICRTCIDKYRGSILRQGPIPGLLQLSLEGTRRAKDMARDLLIVLRNPVSPNHGFRRKGTRNGFLEQIIENIESVEDEKAAVTAMRSLEEMITELRSHL
ncbi:PREDICTED: U-box domain-containing protein 10 [Nelumbo nucifera]|uniref:U-box domain-containing protein n=2 Tax=Nelumbo nucifera TaxID=4432 RepID=A0A822YNF0_NELNU|nr:PREDICTED: U-box domain-containing protein 10 [Nelumbo nucifera]DAD30818.1 TPA_asm: hypothetical protein HUJ06_009669 [Nelumbo nucifera]